MRSPPRPDRRQWRRPGLWLCLLVPVLALAGEPEEYAGEAASWRRYQSPHFELFSANADRASRELLHNLELLHTLFFEAFRLKERCPLPVTIYYFNKEKTFKQYLAKEQRDNSGLIGYYLLRPDRATIVISPTWNDAASRRIIFHEYVHHLVRIAGEDPPLWFNEGLAELYSSLEFRPDFAQLGAALPAHISLLYKSRLLPLETLFSVDRSSAIYSSGVHAGLFYAESWALLHCWLFGSEELDRSKLAKFMAYLSQATERGDPETRRRLFEEATGGDYAAMEKKLAKYVQQGSYTMKRIAVPPIAGGKSYEQWPVARAEAREALAELDLRVNRTDKARQAMLRAAERPQPSIRAIEALASDAHSQEQPEVALERWRLAMAAGTTNPAVFHVLVQLETQRVLGKFYSDSVLPDEQATNLRQLLKRSIAYTPDQVMAYEMLAWVEAKAGQPDVANVNLIQRHFYRLQHKASTLVALALVRIHLNQPEEAREYLDAAAASQPGWELDAMINTIRAQLP